MKSTSKAVTSLAVLAMVGCGAEQGAEERQATGQTVQAVESTNTEGWTKIAPGVWERARLAGGVERMGFGREAFEFALQRARFEQATMMIQMKELGGSNAALARQMDSNTKRIQFLEKSVEEARVAEALAMDIEPFASGSSGSPSGSVCGGSYYFTITFQFGMVDGSVTSKAEWSEFGPFAPYKKTFHTYARASMEDNITNEDSDAYGPFSDDWLVIVTSSASISPTFVPQLYGSTYLSVTDGCSASRFYEAWSY